MDLQHGSWIAWIKFNEHKDTLLNRHVSLTPFFFPRFLAAFRSQGTVFFIRLQALGLSYTGQSADVQSPKAK